MTDEGLVEALKNADAKAFIEIYQRYFKVSYHVAFNETYLKEEAEDIVHSFFESLWKNRENVEIRKLSTYIVVSVKYLSYAFFKSQINLKKYREHILFQNIYQDNSVENLVNQNDLQKAIENAMKKLPEKTAEIFTLSRLKHKTIGQIAEELNLSEKAIEYHITKSLKVLKEQLETYKQNN